MSDAVGALKITALQTIQQLDEEELEIVVRYMNNMIKSRDKDAPTVQSYS
jgi:hypothetical protein